MITFSCECGKQYSVKDECAGKRAKCQCGKSLIVPAPDLAQQDNSPSAEAQSKLQLTPHGSSSVRSRRTGRLAVVAFAVIALAATGIGIWSLTKRPTYAEPVPELPIIATSAGWQIQARAAEFIGITSVQPSAQAKPTNIDTPFKRIPQAASLQSP